MLSTITKRLSAFVLSAVMLLLAVPANAVTTDSADETDTEIIPVETLDVIYERKIDPIVLERIEKADEDDLIDVQIRFVDNVDNEAIENEVYAKTGISIENMNEISNEEFQEQLETWSDEDEENLRKTVEPENLDSARNAAILARAKAEKKSKYDMTKVYVKKEVYNRYNDDCLRLLDIGVTEDDILYNDPSGARYILFLSKYAIMAAAKYDIIEKIDDGYHFVPSDDGIPQPNPLFSDKLNEAIKNRLDGDVPVCIKISKEEYINYGYPDTDNEDVLKTFALEEGKTNVFLRHWIEQFDIEKYQPQFQYEASRSIYVMIPIYELERIASEFGEIIDKVYLWQAHNSMVMTLDRIFSYTSGDSLNILRASVGLEEKHWNAFYDVNQDGSIDSSDALTALRASVGLEQVSYNICQLYPLYDVEEYGLPYFYNGSFVS